MKSNTAVICLSPYSGGMEIDAIKLSKKLSNHCNITLIAKKNHFIHNKKEDYIGYENIHLEAISFNSSLSLSIIFNVRKIVKKNNIKNIVFFGASELKSLYFSLLGLDINLIVRHGTTKSKPKKDFFHKLVYSNINYHVSICKHLLNNVRNIIPFGKNTKEKLIYSSFEFNDPIKIEHNVLNILHVGRIADAKGQIDAIKACKILVDNNIDFMLNLVGGFDDKYKAYFMKEYQKCKYKEKVNLIGFNNDISSFLNKSDIFLFPSYGEGLSNAFLEAISNNLVCICYDNTSFPELKELGLYFYMAKNKNIQDLRNILLKVSNDINNERLLASSNNALARELFSKDKEINSYMEILE